MAKTNKIIAVLLAVFVVFGIVGFANAKTNLITSMTAYNKTYKKVGSAKDKTVYAHRGVVKWKCPKEFKGGKVFIGTTESKNEFTFTESLSTKADNGSYDGKFVYRTVYKGKTYKEKYVRLLFMKGKNKKYSEVQTINWK